MELTFSFIVPVYNRPQEVEELLQSLCTQTVSNFEVVIIEDGSDIACDAVVDRYKDKLQITYLFKSNSGPGPSRNYGMQRAAGNYFIILDSDCILPSHYMKSVQEALAKTYVDFFGGPDAAHKSFSSIQKAINFSMTSLLTTGGIRGSKNSVNTFQPRSFNMGLSKDAFRASQGFGKIHPGEDPDLVLRLWKAGFKSRLLEKAYVYHKRRISWSKFYTQVHKFGMVRPILNQWHPDSKRLTFWFPTLFLLGCIIAIIAGLLGWFLPLLLLAIYILMLFLLALYQTHSLKIALLGVVATAIQFYAYGVGFLKSTYYVGWRKFNPKKKFPQLFFK
ncbi:MAG: glycosyltransferase [Dokdonia sp.]|jgi:glycosyltransferase involved in cell wall biosynthesis